MVFVCMIMAGIANVIVVWTSLYPFLSCCVRGYVGHDRNSAIYTVILAVVVTMWWWTHVCLYLACRLSVNHSLGMIDVAPSVDNNPLICSWTIGNVGITNALAIIIIERINISSCRYLDYLSCFLCFAVREISTFFVLVCSVSQDWKSKASWNLQVIDRYNLQVKPSS